MLSLLVWGDAGWLDELAFGFFVTLQLATAAYLVGLLIGILGASAKRSRRPILRGAASTYSTIFRAIPELVVISLIYFGGSIAIGHALRPLGVTGYVEVNAFASGVAALGLVQGAYQTEVLRGALQSLPVGQWEAGQALGLRRAQLFFLVILPQVWRLALPGMSNLWMTVLKGTALVSVIGLEDLLRAAALGAASTRAPFPFYTAVVLGYLFITAVSNQIVAVLEAHVNRGQEAA